MGGSAEPYSPSGRPAGEEPVVGREEPVVGGPWGRADVPAVGAEPLAATPSAFARSRGSGLGGHAHLGRTRSAERGGGTLAGTAALHDRPATRRARYSPERGEPATAGPFGDCPRVGT